MTDSDSVLDAARRRSAALVDKDVGALMTLLHPRFVYVNASGLVLDRDQYLDRYVRPEQVRWTGQTILAPRVALADAVAVLTCLVHDVVSFDGRVLDETFRTTLTWISSDHGWQCLAGHTSRVPA